MQMQTAQMIQDSLDSAMQIRAQREMQMREIESAATIERQRIQSEEYRQRAATTAAMESQKLDIEARRANTQLEQRGATRRARIGEAGANARQNQGLAQDAQQFQQRFSLEQERFGEDKRRNALLSEQQAFAFKSNYEQERREEQIRQLRSLVPVAMAAGVYEGGPIPGSQLPNIGAIQSFLGGMQQPAGEVGPPTAQQDAAGSPGAAANMAEILQQFAQPRNELAGKRYATDDPMGGQGGGMSGPTVMGRLDVGKEQLEQLRPLARNPSDAAVLDSLIARTSSGAMPSYDVSTGTFRSPEIQGVENADEVLNRLVGTGFGTQERFVGSLVAPLMGPSEQTKIGGNVIGSGRAAPRQAAQGEPQSVPRGTPSQGQAAPPAASAAPQAPAQEPTGAEATGDMEPKTYGSIDAINQRVDSQIATDEARTRGAMGKYNAKYGITTSEPRSPSQAPSNPAAAPVPSAPAQPKQRETPEQTQARRANEMRVKQSEADWRSFLGVTAGQPASSEGAKAKAALESSVQRIRARLQGGTPYKPGQLERELDLLESFNPRLVRHGVEFSKKQRAELESLKRPTRTRDR